MCFGVVYQSVLSYSSSVKDCFRQAASLLLLRPTQADQYELLLLHKPRKRDAWQLPQGGREADETVEQCAVRELQEEAGIANVTVLGVSDLIYEYKFPASYRRFRPDHICGQQIAFVYGVCPADTEVKVDGVEVDRYQWIAPPTVGKILRRKEYLTIVKSLIDEALIALKNT